LKWWTDNGNDVPQGIEGATNWQPLDTLDGDLLSEFFPPQCLSDETHPGPLTSQVHEPQPCFPPAISQSVEEASAENFRSQFSLDPLLYAPRSFPGNSPWPPTPSLVGHPKNEPSSSPSLLPSPNNSTVQSASPASNGLASDNIPVGKREIAHLQEVRSCTACRQSFSTATRYRQHLHSCGAGYKCHGCPRVFKLLKDLERHQGLREAAPACPALKTSRTEVKHFACTCGESYTRKDSLQRHMNRDNVQGHSQQHRCKACNQSHCSCGKKKKR
jgi:hypothetical protein